MPSQDPLRLRPLRAAAIGPADPSPLAALADLASEVGVPSVASEAFVAGQRIAEGCFYVACVGQYKRGKSTLLNALVGRPVLPVGVTPVTSVVTVMRYGERESARVRFAGGGWREITPGLLAAYVTEQQNPENKLGVSAVEVFVPSPLLAAGMCLVDTPGIGSVFEGNSEATRAFVPHVDAALVVLGADPPVSGDELALIAEVALRVRDLVVVLNKADRLAGHERDEVARFTEGVLARRLGRPVPRVLEVSAAERLEGQGPDRDWPALQHALQRLTHQAGADLLRGAERRETARLAARVLAEVDEQRGALLRPAMESERRIAGLAESLGDAERSMADLGYLLQAEVDRLSRRLEKDRDAFLNEAIPAARIALRAAIEAAPDRRLRAAAHVTARTIARERLDAWLASEHPVAERLYRDAATRFLSLADEFLARFLRSGEVGLSALPPALGSEAGFRGRSHLYFSDLLASTSPPAFAWLSDRVLPAGTVRRRVSAEGDRVLERLLSSNSARAQNDLVDRVRESRRKLEAEIRGRLSEALSSATAALERAQERQAAGAESVREELERLESIRGRAEVLCAGACE